MTLEPAPSVIAALDSFDAGQRRRALRELAARPADCWPPPTERFNLHAHSFFSYNARGYSPSRLAYEARRAGLYAAGLCDFDVLDGLEEFLEAGRALGLRTAVHLETRAFWDERARHDINSPGEPGVLYILGGGFPRAPEPGTAAAETLAAWRRQAGARNRALVARINARLPALALDYEAAVVPLSPGGCPTERHIVSAYRDRALAAFPEPDARHAFWAAVFGAAPADAAAWERDCAGFEERIRARLVKRGGLGYEPPAPETFPPVEAFIKWVLACRALPMIAWLDGSTPGEADPAALLEALAARGACALNIIPDRNVNVRDPGERARKTAALAEIVRLAEARRFPVNIGTEMNKDGQPFVDDTACAALRPYHSVFLRGARILVGQSLLARYTPMAYVGPEAEAEFGPDTRWKNECFEAVGRLPPLTDAHDACLKALGPERAYARLRDAARQGAW